MLALLTEDAPHKWRGSSRLLDLEDPKLRICALRLTQLAETDIQKAVLIHNFIKSLPFGCVAAFDHMSAGAVLKSGRGDCHTKGTLFVALLRSSGVSARLRFVTMSTAFLHGIIDTNPSAITHAVGEVYLQGRWVQTDAYVTDSLLDAQAAALLRLQGRSAGYGIHANGRRSWDGCQDSHAQYAASDLASLPVHDWGVAHDPEDFYSKMTDPSLRLGWLTRAKWILAAPLVNRRVQQVRSRRSAAVQTQ